MPKPKSYLRRHVLMHLTPATSIRIRIYYCTVVTDCSSGGRVSLYGMNVHCCSAAVCSLRCYAVGTTFLLQTLPLHSVSASFIWTNGLELRTCTKVQCVRKCGIICFPERLVQLTVVYTSYSTTTTVVVPGRSSM